MCTSNSSLSRRFFDNGSGCPVSVGNTTCGESNSLEITKEFKRLYEERLQQIDAEAGGDCSQEKIKLQQEWIRNLTQQNEMLVKAVQELEYEATDRVQQLEEKLERSAQCLCEVMKTYREHDFTADLLADPLQKISHLEDDIRNVIEFIRRVREGGEWSVDGLSFFNVTKEDLLGIKCKHSNKMTVADSNEGERLLNEKERTVQELQQKINYYNSVGDVECMAKELKCRREECESLKQAMVDMRQVLTEEVASKHDQVLLMKKNIQELEERCMQADKQTAFKDDITKELRKEIKQLRQQKANSTLEDSRIKTSIQEIMQLKDFILIKDRLLEEQLTLIKVLITKLFTVDKSLKYLEERTLYVTSYTTDCANEKLRIKITSLESENTSLKDTLNLEKTHIVQLDEQFQSFLQDRDDLKRKSKSLERKIKLCQKEREMTNCECESLKAQIQKLKDQNENLKNEIESTKERNESCNNESEVCSRRLVEVMEENRKIIEQVLMLNEENRNLSNTIDALRQRTDLTVSLTQEEMTKFNATIEELQSTLENTRLAQQEEEIVHYKEISQLNKTINELEHNLKTVQDTFERDCKVCKICRGKSKVGFAETTGVQANLENKESELNKALKETETKMRFEIEKKNNEIQILKKNVSELESALNSCEERAANLQEAVVLYSNSVNVLEASEEEAKIEIRQQKITISNLQQALVEAKQEVDDMRRKLEENDTKRQGMINLLENVMFDTEEENELIRHKSEIVNKEYEQLQDLNFTLEVDHCDSLQDIEILESQINKYKSVFKEKEIECECYKDQMKKLSKQKRCYEEIVVYFKHEMGLMADQLNNLQELLTLSNESAQEESSKIMQAFMEVQSLNQRLSSQLCACEQKVQLENQMNQLHESKICELQQLVNEKEIDLTKHDQAILNIRGTLQDSLKQNEELQGTISELNETICQLQCAVKRYEYENCQSKRSTQEFQDKIGGYCERLEELKKSLDEKTAECLKLEMAYNNEKRALKSAQKDLQETERKQQEKQTNLVGCLEEIKQNLKASNENNSKLCAECETLQGQVANLSRKEAVKDLEIKRYRKIVSDLKSTMMELNSELNKNLAQKELKGSCKNASCRQNAEQSDTQDICLSCPCEVEFYQKMVDILKKSVTDLKRKLAETIQKNKHIEEEIKQKDIKISELQRDQTCKEKEWSKLNEELEHRLQQAYKNNQKNSELQREIDHLREELQVKTLQLNDVKRSAQEINGSKCVQLACAQEEMTNLKNEMTNLISLQYGLKRENEELQNQTAQLQCNVNCLDNKNKMLKEQVDQYLVRIKNLNSEKDTLLRKNKELLSELKSLQSMYYSMDKQNRLTNDSLKHLETEMEDLKNNREEICLESKNVLKNIRSWVKTQKRINQYTAEKEKEYLATISCSVNSPCKSQRSQNRTINPSRPVSYKSNSKAMCGSPCSLGSQGTASFYDGESPPTSPEYNDVHDWYSTTFRSESENDSEEDYCVNTLENLTHQMKKSNKIWMNEKKVRPDYAACKDTKDKK